MTFPFSRDAAAAFVENSTASTVPAWFDTVPEGYLLVDPELVILYVNPAFACSLGKSAAALLGQSLREVCRNTESDVAYRLAGDAVSSGRIQEYVRTEGDRPYRLSARPVAEGVLLSRSDIAIPMMLEDGARLHDQTLQTKKRESLTLLAAGVAHDINNLLSAVIGSAGLLLRELPADGPSHESAALIKKAAERAADVTRQMLVYAGKNVLSRRPTDPNEFVAGCTDAVRDSVGVPLELRLDDSMPEVLVDRAGMQQALLILVNNAVEAIGSRPGMVIVRTGSVDSPRAKSVFIEVSDNGCGMPAEVQSRAFDPFFTTKGRGRGLGLSLAQGLVRSHGGQIELSSTVGQGTTARITLPAGEAPASR